MSIRLRKLVGSLALVLFVGLYMVLAVEVTAIFLADKSSLIQAVGYAIAGLVWVLPAGAIISWTLKPGS